MHISIVANEDRTDRDRDQLRRLGAAVYPPDESADDPVTRITWASTEWSIMIRMKQDGEIVAHAGVLARECLQDGQPVRIGGVGGVKSHPAARGQHFGLTVMNQATDVLRDVLNVDFGLLVCPDRVVGFYERLGWRRFDGNLLVEQPDGRTTFTFNQVMVLPVLTPAPVNGEIDLQGFPW